MQLQDSQLETLQQTSAGESVRRLQAGALTSETLTTACLARSELVAEVVQAWDALDPSYALAQARERDADKQTGRPLGRLHGLPVAVEASFDSRDYAGSDGPARKDAYAVAALRAAGAVLLGKARAPRFAIGASETACNPYRPERGTGGAGGAAAALVSAGVVPVALGARSDGAIALPASFCGVVGYKPSRGLIPRSGTGLISATLGQVGVFARNVEDTALVAGALAGWDAGDEDSRVAPAPGLAEICATEPPVTPRLAFLRTPFWDSAAPATRDAFGELLGALDQDIQAIELGADYADAPDALRRLLACDLAFAKEGEARSTGGIDGSLAGLLEEGRSISALFYRAALQAGRNYATALAELFEEFDAIVAPAAPGEANEAGNEAPSTDFSALWSLSGLPTVTVPLMTGEEGLPLGVQLVGAERDDARLLRTARWLTQSVEAALAAEETA